MSRVFAAMCVVVLGCGFPALPKLSNDDADAGTDGSGMDAASDGRPKPAVGPSCTSSAQTSICGLSSNDDCCATTEIAGGIFFRSFDAANDMFTDMSHPATVSTVWLDTYEVTVGRFRAFVAAGYGTQAQPPAPNAGARTLNGLANQGGWDTAWDASLAVDASALMTALKCGNSYTWTDSLDNNENKPISCLTWYDAFAFCVWDGGFLPTEAEWNYAAAGGNEHRAYPWSNPASATTIDCAHANYFINDPAGTYCVNAPNRVGSESPKGNGRWGHVDMAGNVYEWVLDYSSASAPDYPTTTCDDCANLTVFNGKIRRGGAFGRSDTQLRSGYRSGVPASIRNDDMGVRCARMPK